MREHDHSLENDFNNYERLTPNGEAALQVQIDQLADFPTDLWLSPLAKAFVTGIHSGLQNGYIDQHVKRNLQVHNLISVDVRQAAVKTDKDMFPLLTKWLNNPDSVAFMEMDTAITEQVLDQNQLTNWEELDEIENPSLTAINVLNIYIADWQFGYKNYIYDMWATADQPEDEDSTSWIYLQAGTNAQNAVDEQFTGCLDDQNLRDQIADQILLSGWNDLIKILE